jgi:hypothetical protein
VYSRTLDGEVLTLAASGWTYENLFVLHDRQTESLWYDFGDGEGLTCVAGPHLGRRLPERETAVLPWSRWKGDHPTTKVLPSRNGRPQ